MIVLIIAGISRFARWIAWSYVTLYWWPMHCIGNRDDGSEELLGNNPTDLDIIHLICAQN
jgi:hypothetical protein